MGRGYATDKTLQNAVGETANGNALCVVGLRNVAFQVTGITSATITFEATIDGSTWVSLFVRNIASEAALTAATTTANGVFTAPCMGLSLVRARISTYVSGTITVVALAT